MALLLLVAIISVVTLWTISPTGETSESIFGIYLAVDLVCFAMISHIYRSTKEGGRVGKIPILAGCILVLVLIGAGFAA